LERFIAMIMIASFERAVVGLRLPSDDLTSQSAGRLAFRGVRARPSTCARGRAAALTTIVGLLVLSSGSVAPV
jgi:hypothetical protein